MTGFNAPGAPAPAAGAPLRGALGPAFHTSRRPRRPLRRRPAGRLRAREAQRRRRGGARLRLRERELPKPLLAAGTDGVPSDRIVFLERRAGLFGSRIDRRMPEALRLLADAAARDIGFEVDLVPVSLFWGRAPGRQRSWFRLLVAEGWDIGGRFRKVISLLVNGRNLLLLFGDRAAAAAVPRRDARTAARAAPAVAAIARATAQPARRHRRSRPLAPPHDRGAGAAHPQRAPRRARRDAGAGRRPARTP